MAFGPVQSDFVRQHRAQQAMMQWEIIDQMCEELDMSMSALADLSGVNNSTITRYRNTKKRPNKWETIGKMIVAYEKLMKDKERQPDPNILKYRWGWSGTENVAEDKFTPSRLKLALSITNGDFGLGLSDKTIQDIINNVSSLYEIIAAEEKRTGKPIPNDESGYVRIRRERAQRDAAKSNGCG